MAEAMSIEIDVSIQYDNLFLPSVGKLGNELYLNEELADFHFIFESNDEIIERVPAHKLLLATSDVLRTMFNGNWLEKIDAKIVDASAEALKEFLQFFYLVKVKLTDENVAEVMYLGKKYNVIACVDLCRKFLKTILNNDNVLTIFGVAIDLDDLELKLSCNWHIAYHTSETLTEMNFLKCNRNVLVNILKFDCISCPETELVEATLNWIKMNSGQENLTQKLLHDQYADLFHGIRFGSISIEEFAALYKIYGYLITRDELGEIIQMIASKDFKPSMFHGNRRQIIKTIEWNENQLRCYRQLDGDKDPYYIQSVETTTFSMNKPLWLGTIVCEELSIDNVFKYNSLENVLSTEITLSKIDSEHSEKLVLFNGRNNLGKKDMKYINLPKPILIEPEYHYEIRMKQSPPEGCFTIYPLTQEVKFDDDYIVKFHNTSTTEEKQVTRGTIYGLEFIKANA